MNSETRQCNKCKQDFILDQDDFSFYKKIKVPVPNVCSDCRFKMLALWRNETSLYSGRKCEICKKDVVSMYNPKSKYNIFCYECYMSDNWDSKDYAQEYDFSKNFFDQLNNLLHKVPKSTTFLSTGDGPNINSQYANMSGGLKNCYLVFNSGAIEDGLYSRGVRYSRDFSDCFFGQKIERCYESINVFRSNGVIFGKNIYDSIDSFFVLNCSGLNNCFGCVNLRNKSNYWFNEKITPEEYSKRIKEIKGSYSKTEEYKDKFEKFCLRFPYRENNNLKTTNSIGDNLIECKNVKNSFEAIGAENSKLLFSTRNTKDSDGVVGYGYNSELFLNCVAAGYSSFVIGSNTISNCKDILYSIAMRNCHDCIGCDGLKNAEYCVFNKQYSKEEYERLKEHIVKELTNFGIYGLMMSPEIAPFAYNETIAQDNMPLTKKEALAQGFRWEDDIQKTEGKETLLTENIPDHIKDVSDSITKEVLKCINCERNYKITEQELLFYRKLVLPIPRKCFFCRHKDRIIRRGPFKFFIRKCDNCDKDTHTNLTEEVAPIMYCEKCYQQEII
ncbi:MAG: hypothetical protein WC264_01425 [Candidatus Paceibacterota bacterium]|jgi:hypothetical protein